MLSKFEFTSNADAKDASTTLVFDIGEAPSGGTGQFPVKDLTYEYNRDNQRRPKMEMVGSWYGFQKINEILIHMEFDVFGDTTALFNANKFALNNLLCPADPTALLTTEPLGTLVMRFDGDTEDMQAPVTIDGDVTFAYIGPTFANGQITWVVAQGYFKGVTTPSNIYYPK